MGDESRDTDNSHIISFRGWKWPNPSRLVNDILTFYVSLFPRPTACAREFLELTTLT
jgi:hypothetical protein